MFLSLIHIYKMSGIGFVERQLIGYEDEMTSHCIGSIPELFDGNPPFQGRGAVSLSLIHIYRDHPVWKIWSKRKYNVWDIVYL